MKKVIYLFVLLFIFKTNADAKVWRVNNNTGVNADFNNLVTAINTAAAGDTLMVEASATFYSSPTLTKKFVIIGPGYYLNDATPNPKTQANKQVSYLGTVTFNPGSDGSVIMGCSMGSVYLNANNITIERSNVTGSIYMPNPGTMNSNNDTIRQNVLTDIKSLANSGHASDAVIYNNIFTAEGLYLTGNPANFSGYFINNIILNGATMVCNNFTFQNNIFVSANFGTYQSSNAFFNNLTGGTGLPTGNNNINNVDLNSVFVGYSSGTGYSSDGRFKLKAGSPAINAGVLNGVTVDCGIFGGPAPYVLSGIPAIPSIYELTVPASVPSGATSMNITISSTTVH